MIVLLVASSLLCLTAGYVLLSSRRYSRKASSQMLEPIPFRPEAVEVIRQLGELQFIDPTPTGQLAVGDLVTMYRNSRIFTSEADRLRHLAADSRESERKREVLVLHRMFLTNHEKLTKYLAQAVAEWVTSRTIGATGRFYVAAAACSYVEEVDLLSGIATLSDARSSGILEAHV